MNREQLLAFLKDMKHMRTAISDDIAVVSPCVYPQWSGENINYTTEDRVLFEENLYRVLVDHTSQPSWTPAAAPSLFTKVLIQEDKILPWEQPESTNPYKTGDKVTHKGNTWISTIDGNIWEPGVYGWEITE